MPYSWFYQSKATEACGIWKVPYTTLSFNDLINFNVRRTHKTQNKLLNLWLQFITKRYRFKSTKRRVTAGSVQESFRHLIVFSQQNPADNTHCSQQWYEAIRMGYCPPEKSTRALRFRVFIEGQSHRHGWLSVWLTLISSLSRAQVAPAWPKVITINYTVNTDYRALSKNIR